MLEGVLKELRLVKPENHFEPHFGDASFNSKSKPKPSRITGMLFPPFRFLEYCQVCGKSETSENTPQYDLRF